MSKFKITKVSKLTGEKETEIMRLPNSDLKSLTRIMQDVHEDYEVSVEELPTVYDKQIIKAQISSGKEVELRGFSFHLTYGDMMEGDPDKYWNEDVLNYLDKKFKDDYVPSIVRRPGQELIDDELPVFYGVVHWVCYGETPEEKTTELRVIWFMDSIDQVSVQDMLEDSIAGLDWDIYARGYDPSDF